MRMWTLSRGESRPLSEVTRGVTFRRAPPRDDRVFDFPCHDRGRRDAGTARRPASLPAALVRRAARSGGPVVLLFLSVRKEMDGRRHLLMNQLGSSAARDKGVAALQQGALARLRAQSLLKNSLLQLIACEFQVQQTSRSPTGGVGCASHLQRCPGQCSSLVVWFSEPKKKLKKNACCTSSFLGTKSSWVKIFLDKKRGCGSFRSHSSQECSFIN